MRRYLIGVVLVMLLAAACAPGAAPPTPTPAATRAAVTPTTAQAAGVTKPAAAPAWARLVEAAKREGDTMNLQAGGTTFGGPKAFEEYTQGFNKMFGLNAKLILTPGPNMPQMAAKVISEAKAGQPASTDIFLGAEEHIGLLMQEAALQPVDWTGLFPWITEEMLVNKPYSIHVYSAPQVGAYNTKLVPVAEVPKKLEDFLDPKWRGKMAIPPYSTWLADWVPVLGEQRVKEITRGLMGQSPGFARYGEVGSRIASGEFALSPSVGDMGDIWDQQRKGAPVEAINFDPYFVVRFQLAVPKNSAHSNLATLFASYVLTREGQVIMDKYALYASHLVEGTKINEFLKEYGKSHKVVFRDAAFQASPDGIRLKDDLTKIITP